MEYGIQLYSLRDVAREDLHKAVVTAAELGFKYIEFAGFFDHPAKEVKGWLDELGLKCCSTHTKFALIQPDCIDETIAYHKEIGCDTVIVPGGVPICSDEELDSSFAIFNEAQKKFAENGMKLGYHNHSPEFLMTPFGKLVINEILERTDIMLEPDTFWIFNAGLDPVEFLEAHKDRIALIHLKDGITVPVENRKWETWNQGSKGKALGEGEAPVLKVRDWAIKNNVLMVVESEGLDPTGPQEVARSVEFLKKLD